jgi:hypothetical protein
MRLITFLILLLICKNMYCQISNDSVSKTLRLVPRFAVNIQRGYGLECGLFLNKFYVRFPEFTKAIMLPYESSGFYVSTEVSLRNFDKMVFGPKIGWEFGGIGETTASHMGAEFIYYTDFSTNAPAIMIKLGLPLLWLNVGYVYTMYLEKENILRNEIGKHRLTISYFLNRKAKKEFNRLKENLIKKRQIL